MAQNQRHLDIELIRIIACFFVIFNHTGEDGFFLFSRYDWKSISFWIYLMISIFCKCSVPLFFAVTGALLLEKEETAGRLWRHRIGRTGLILLFWSFFYYLEEIRLGWRTFQIGEFAGQFFYGDWNLSFWYLYAYIVSAKYSCGFPNFQASDIMVVDRYLDYFTTIMEDRLWQVLAKPGFRWRNRSGLSMHAAKAA